VFDFICEEKIKETHYNLLKNLNWYTIAVGPRRLRAQGSALSYIQPKKPSDYIEYAADASKSRSILKEEGDQVVVEELNPMPKAKVVRRIQVIDPKKTQRNKFHCDSLIVKKDGDVDERRIVLKENGRRTADRNEFLEEERFTGLSPLFAPLRVLAPSKLIETEKMHGKNAHVIEAMPKYGNENGILFPSCSSVRVAYPGIDHRGAINKIRIYLSYDKYKFFTVETDQEVIKKISADLLIKRSRERLKVKNLLPLVPCIRK